MKTDSTKHHEGHDNKTLELIINGKKHEWAHQYISGAEVRNLGNIPKEDEVFLDIEKPWDDEPIMDDTPTDLARPGIEQFFSKKYEHDRLVNISINDNEHKISRGKHTVVEIKKLGDVPINHELEELIKGKLTPLGDEATILIKGCEQFFSHVRDGSSS